MFDDGFKELSSPTRRRMLELLRERGMAAALASTLVVGVYSFVIRRRGKRG